jgi:hypothetical protein
MRDDMRQGRPRRLPPLDPDATTKHCRACDRDLPLGSFGKHASRRDGLRDFCRECTNARHRSKYPERAGREKEWRDRHPERYRDLRLRSRYGLDVEAYEAMHEAQEGRCGICGGTETFEHKRLCVDHDHETGVVRALLCTRCNKSLGGFQDDPALLRKAAEYLEHWSAWQASRAENAMRA